MNNLNYIQRNLRCKFLCMKLWAERYNINNFPETLIQVCSNELLYNDAIEFTKKLREKGTKYELQVWDDLWHAWHFFPINESYEATKKVISFITADSYSSPK